MKHAIRSTLLVLTILAATAPGGGDASADDDISKCFSIYGEARYGALAYKHVVIVSNRCDIELQCEVWTDVDPSPKRPVSVGPKGTGEVIVRGNSPARSFKAFGECKQK